MPNDKATIRGQKMIISSLQKSNAKKGEEIKSLRLIISDLVRLVGDLEVEKNRLEIAFDKTQNIIAFDKNQIKGMHSRIRDLKSEKISMKKQIQVLFAKETNEKLTREILGKMLEGVLIEELDERLT